MSESLVELMVERTVVLKAGKMVHILVELMDI